MACSSWPSCATAVSIVRSPLPCPLATSAVLLSGRRQPGPGRKCSKFLLGVRQPRVEFLLAHHLDHYRHEGVVATAQLRALAVVDAFARRLEPGLVEPARD